MFSWYKYLIVNLVFSHLGFWSGNHFLFAPFPDLCLLVTLCYIRVANTKALISCAVTAQLIFDIDFAKAKIQFSHVSTPMINVSFTVLFEES